MRGRHRWPFTALRTYLSKKGAITRTLWIPQNLTESWRERHHYRCLLEKSNNLQCKGRTVITIRLLQLITTSLSHQLTYQIGKSISPFLRRATRYD